MTIFGSSSSFQKRKFNQVRLFVSYFVLIISALCCGPISTLYELKIYKLCTVHDGEIVCLSIKKKAF
jgi:hypothetical protein